MGRTYEYYIWSDDLETDDDLQERIEEALRDSGTLQFEYKTFEED